MNPFSNHLASSASSAEKFPTLISSYFLHLVLLPSGLSQHGYVSIRLSLIHAVDEAVEEAVDVVWAGAGFGVALEAEGGGVVELDAL